MSERKLTIARALTRLKTSKAQLEQIAAQIQKYGAWTNKAFHPLGDVATKDLNINHKTAREKVQSLYQQFNDLTKEIVKLKVAIEKANLTTNITIGEGETAQTMTISEALNYRREVEKQVRQLTFSYNASVAAAQNNVNRYNQQWANADESAKATLLSDVLYLVNPAEIKKHEDFLSAFMTELDGELNAINAVTEIELG
jgi:hypothetical protein